MESLERRLHRIDHRIAEGVVFFPIPPDLLSPAKPPVADGDIMNNGYLAISHYIREVLLHPLEVKQSPDKENYNNADRNQHHCLRGFAPRSAQRKPSITPTIGLSP